MTRVEREKDRAAAHAKRAKSTEAMFASRLHEIMEKRKLSTTGLAKRLGRSVSTVSQWANNDTKEAKRKTLPDTANLLHIASTLRVTVDYLLGREGAQEHLGQTRAGPDFYADVAEDVARRVRIAAEGEPWARGIPWEDLSVGGEAVLERAAQQVLAELARASNEADRIGAAARDAVIAAEASADTIAQLRSPTLLKRREREPQSAYEKRLRGAGVRASAVARAARASALRAGLVGDRVFGYRGGTRVRRAGEPFDLARDGRAETPLAFLGEKRRP